MTPVTPAEFPLSILKHKEQRMASSTSEITTTEKSEGKETSR